MVYLVKRQADAPDWQPGVHFHLPNKAFEPGAASFWLGTVVGAVIVLMMVAPRVNK